MHRKSVCLCYAAVIIFLVGICILSGCVLPLEKQAETYRIAYVPLDNRPVNQERVQYLAQSAGITLVMPQEDLYRTALDNMPPNADGSTIGNREKLCQWLLEADKTCDYFIISLDQMTSGGLVGSRWLSNTDLSFEYSVIDTILSLCERNTVYLFDTVMRLASTVGYQGYTLEEYNTLRAYGMAERRSLAGDTLTVENIIEGYPYTPSGEPVFTEATEKMLEQYHTARARKLRITDYVLRNAENKVAFCYIGVDDSSPQNTIQTNEIQYIKALMGEQGTLSAATDELGMCCLARMIGEIYGKVALNTTYFGGGADKPADGYDIGTLGESVKTHLSALNVSAVENRENALQVLCLTRGSNENDRKALIAQLKENQTKQIPTVLIDVSENPGALGALLMGDEEMDVCRLLGYSSWNTAANAIGIALSQGVARYAYLQAVQVSTQTANEGFLKSMTFAYIKDISYKQFHSNLDGFLTDTYSCNVQTVLDCINRGKMLVSSEGEIASPCGAVAVENFRYPWCRTFEMTFDIPINNQ